MTYVNYASVTAIGVLFPVLTLLVFMLRIHLWLRHSNRNEIDDYLLIGSVMFNVAAGIGMVIGAQMHFVGGHSPPHGNYQEGDGERQLQLQQFEWAYWMGHTVSVSFTKLTILFFFRRLFRGRACRTPFDYANWTLIVLVIGWFIAGLLAFLFECGTHFKEDWSNIAALHDYCDNTFDLNTICAIINWVLDLAILAEPLFTIGFLNMKTGAKVSVSAMFLLAAFAAGAGMARMIVLISILDYNMADPSKKLFGLYGWDGEGIISIVLFWTYMEIGVGCLVACLLPCRRYLHYVSVPYIASSLRSLLSRGPNRSQTKGSI